MSGERIDISQAKCSKLAFSAPVQFLERQQSQVADELTGFAIDAYTGAVVDRWWGKLAIAVDGIRAAQQMPIFLRHDDAKIVGYSTESSSAEVFAIKGVFSRSTDAAREVMGLAAEGFPWQASIGVRPLTVLELREGSVAVVNGREVQGPAEVWLESEVFETSFVPLGADKETRVAVFSEIEPGAMAPTRPEVVSMNIEQLHKDHPDLVAAIRTEALADTESKLAAARKEGADGERARIQEVLQQVIPGHEALVEQLAFDGSTTGPQAAVQVLAAERLARKSGMERFTAEAPRAVPAALSGDDTTKSKEELAKEKWKSDAALRAEFAQDFDTYLAYIGDVPGVRVRSGKQ